GKEAGDSAKLAVSKNKEARHCCIQSLERVSHFWKMASRPGIVGAFGLRHFSHLGVGPNVALPLLRGFFRQAGGPASCLRRPIGNLFRRAKTVNRFQTGCWFRSHESGSTKLRKEPLAEPGPYSRQRNCSFTVLRTLLGALNQLSRREGPKKIYATPT